MGMVLVGLEGIKAGLVASADFLEGLPQTVCYPLGHHLPSVFRDKDDVGMELVDHMATGAELICSHVLILHADHRYVLGYEYGDEPN